MSTREISAAAQALGRRGGLKSLGAKSKAELSAFGKAAAEKRWAAKRAARLHTFTPEAKAAYGDTPPEGAPVIMIVKDPPPSKPLGKKERLAAGMCRYCPTLRAKLANGKTSALWCPKHLEEQRAHDKASWARRHAK